MTRKTITTLTLAITTALLFSNSTAVQADKACCEKIPVEKRWTVVWDVVIEVGLGVLLTGSSLHESISYLSGSGGSLIPAAPNALSPPSTDIET